VNAIAHCFKYPWCQNKNCRCSNDAHFGEVVTISSLDILHSYAAHTMIMGWRHSITRWLSGMPDQKSITLHWSSFLGGCRNLINTNVVYKGGQYVDYRLMLLHNTMIIQHASTKIFDTLTLIFRRCSWYHGQHCSCKGSQLFRYMSQQPSLDYGIRHTRAKILDPSLTLISNMHLKVTASV